MISLLIDTATERGLIALMQDEKVIVQVDLPYGYQNSKFLLPKIEEAFTLANLKPSNLTLVIAGVGPGSYTGIRVGAMAAKTIAFALQIPLVGVCTLEGLMPKAEGSYAALIDAKIGGVYLQVGHASLDGVRELSTPKVLPLSEAIDEIKHVRYVITPTVSLLKNKFEKLQGEGCQEWVESGLNPVAMAKSGLEKFKEGLFSQDGSLELLYLRKTQAEIERGK